MARLSTVAFTGFTKKQYVFDVWNENQEFRNTGAVYAVSRRYQNGATYSHDVAYFGQTGDLSSRFEDHHKLDCFHRHQTNCICTLVEDDEDLRLAIETDLVRHYKPACNG
jgi:hypothetical protein